MSTIGNIMRKVFGRERPATSRPRVRSFEAGRVDDLSFAFTPANAAIDVDVAASLERMRGRSRALANDNDYAKKYLQMVVQNVVGPTGFSLQVLASEGARLDSLANTLIEQSFAAWARRGSCEITGQLSFVDVKSLVAMAVARDGEALVRMVRGQAAGNRWAFTLQVLDIDRLPTNFNLALPGGARIVMGVELDRYGRPVAYHLHRTHPGSTVGAYQQGDLERVPATDILHLFRPVRPEQRRGIPAMHTAMLRMQMLGKFEAAAVVAARKGAETLGFFVTPNGEAPVVGETNADGNQVDTSVPGQYDTLPAGYDFRPYESKYPNEVYAAFVKGALRGIASGLGVSYNSLASDLEGVNYSSIRAGVLEERDAWMAWQNWMIEALLTPVYENWLQSALLAGAVTTAAGNQLPATKVDKFMAHAWQGRRWAWVDPMKDIQANIEAVNAGLKSRREVIAEQGRDIDEVWAQLQAEQAEAELLGLKLGGKPSSPRVPAADDDGASDDQVGDEEDATRSA